MEKLNVYWLSYHEEALARGYWDQGILEEMFERAGAEHHIGIDVEPGEERIGGVVVVNGRMHVEDTAIINNDIAKLDWCLFIITGDEEALFPWRDIHHTLMRVWVQLPRMNQHNDTGYKLINGYPPDTKDLLKSVFLQSIKTRIWDWSFVGQTTHERRFQCAEEARRLPETMHGYIHETKEFGKGIDRARYMEVLASSKVVLCPSGPETPDTFRLYEALEAGCIPIVDAFSTNNKFPGFWQYLFGDDIPFPIIDYWDKLPALLPELLREYPHNANKVFAWWQNFKRGMYFKLIDDVRELSK